MAPTRLPNAPRPDAHLRPSLLASPAPPLATDAEADNELPPPLVGAGLGGLVAGFRAAPPGLPLGPALGLGITRTALGVARSAARRARIDRP